MRRPIHEVLDASALPWRDTRAALAERFGTRPHPAYSWEVIEIATSPPFVEGLLWPLSVQVLPQFSPHVPATDYSGAVWLGDDARENLRHAREQLAERLGEPEASNSSNTIGWRWANGPASVQATVWPRDLQPYAMTNYAHDREPRLVPACSVTIKTGFRVPLSPDEVASLASFERVASIPVGSRTPAHAQNFQARESELEFVREPSSDFEGLFGALGCSRDRTRLIFFHEQLYVIPMSQVIRFHVERTLPAKGSGGSRLQLACHTDYEAHPEKRIEICAGTGPEDLNELAAEISARIGKPFELGPHDYDC
jgi:hypothetical protein